MMAGHVDHTAFVRYYIILAQQTTAPTEKEPHRKGAKGAAGGESFIEFTHPCLRQGQRSADCALQNFAARLL
jgi:hypothetical protein